MFKKIADIFGGNLLKNATNLIDEVVTSKEEKAALKNRFQQITNEAKSAAYEYALGQQEHITKRHSADMSSDSWLSKNIRPLTLIFILVLYSVFSVADGNIGNFNVTDSYVSLLGQWGMLIMSFYFGGRTVEKVGEIIKKSR